MVAFTLLRRKANTRASFNVVPCKLHRFGMEKGPYCAVNGPLASSPDQSTMQLITTTSTDITTHFEPIVPGDFIIAGFISTALVCFMAGWVWANQVVPISRTKLALSKRSGEVRAYLDELIESDPSLIQKDDGDNTNLYSTPAEENVLTDNESHVEQKQHNDRAFERWLFTDWLQQYGRSSVSGRKKQPAVPLLKNAKWNSGDNPVLAATALILLGVMASSVAERIAGL